MFESKVCMFARKVCNFKRNFCSFVDFFMCIGSLLADTSMSTKSLFRTSYSCSKADWDLFSRKAWSWKCLLITKTELLCIKSWHTTFISDSWYTFPNEKVP